MKQEIKKLVFLFLMMGFSTASHEKTCTIKNKCAGAQIAVEKSFDKNIAPDTDVELLLMAASQFIILQ